MFRCHLFQVVEVSIHCVSHCIRLVIAPFGVWISFQTMQRIHVVHPIAAIGGSRNPSCPTKRIPMSTHHGIWIGNSGRFRGRGGISDDIYPSRPCRGYHVVHPIAGIGGNRNASCPTKRIAMSTHHDIWIGNSGRFRGRGGISDDIYPSRPCRGYHVVHPIAAIGGSRNPSCPTKRIPMSTHHGIWIVKTVTPIRQSGLSCVSPLVGFTHGTYPPRLVLQKSSLPLRLGKSWKELLIKAMTLRLTTISF